MPRFTGSPVAYTALTPSAPMAAADRPIARSHGGELFTLGLTDRGVALGESGRQHLATPGS
jgi:hypothetical protein